MYNLEKGSVSAILNAEDKARAGLEYCCRESLPKGKDQHS